MLLDAEGNDFTDLVSLIELQLSKAEERKIENKRTILNLFATLRLIASMVYFYSKEAENLHPAKFCIDTIVLKTWAWILRGKKEKRPSIIKHFNSLVLLQMQIYEEYLNKVLRFAELEKGLYGFVPSDTEYIFYPLRCYDFLGDMVYFFTLTEAYVQIPKKEERKRMLTLKKVIKNNSACAVPLLDTHSIPILMVFRYLFQHATDEDYQFIGEYLMDTIFNLTKRFFKQKMWPEMSGRRMALAKSLYEKSEDYCSESSLLILDIFELIAYMDTPELYNAFKKVVEESEVNLQVAYPIKEEFDIEQLLFARRLNDELSVETNIKLPETVKEFQKSYKKKYSSIDYRTDKVNYGFLRVLAHKYYETDFFPDFMGRAYCEEE